MPFARSTTFDTRRDSTPPIFRHSRDHASASPSIADRIDDLVAINPGYVVIGDSMAGTRIEAPLLAKLTGQSIAPVLQAGTGSAFWYLALKNWVIASGVHPRCTFIFFRDTNLTDALFRAEGRSAGRSIWWRAIARTR